jgi:hypothetical protein
LEHIKENTSLKINHKKRKRTKKRTHNKIKMHNLKKQKKLKQKNKHIHHIAVRLEHNMAPILSQRRMIKLRTKE